MGNYPLGSSSMKKILLLSVSAGAGHVRAAEAIRAYAALHPDGIQATHLDVLSLVPASFRKIYAELYIKLSNDCPLLWGYVYRTLLEGPPRTANRKFVRAIQQLNCHALLAEIKRQRPDAIICTHYLPAELISRQIQKGGMTMPPVWLQVTDYDLRNRWIVPHMRGYFVASEEMAWQARARGIAADAVHVSGIPVMPAFSQPHDRRDCAAQFGLDPDRQTFLLMFGGAGLRGLDSLARRLLALPGDFQLMVLSGRNRAMQESLKKLALQHPGRLFVQSFTDQVERLMACTDLVITKPGGLTCAESLAMGLPMIAVARLPGLEERNADFLLEHGVALKARSIRSAAERVGALLATPERLDAMRQNSAALGCPQAARCVLDHVLAQQPDSVPDTGTQTGRLMHNYVRGLTGHTAGAQPA